ncbi:MAG: dTMP kinase [Clostridia bacterium]|nr:dTMP kinase [Clostridia bacterium]
MKDFITIEGCEGVGKSTQIDILKQYCADNGIPVLFTREPGGSRVAEKIRDIILDADNVEICDMCEAFLYASSRVQHLEEIIIPALNSGKKVICDRFVDSSYAYQGIARGLGLDRVKRLNQLAIGEYMPQYTIFLDLSPRKAFDRKGGADIHDRLETQDLRFHERVYEGYQLLIANEPDRFIIIDASGTIEQVHEQIIAQCKDRGIL